jgi:hypothetical protein
MFTPFCEATLVRAPQETYREHVPRFISLLTKLQTAVNLRNVALFVGFSKERLVS